MVLGRQWLLSLNIVDVLHMKMVSANATAIAMEATNVSFKVVCIVAELHLTCILSAHVLTPTCRS